MSNRIKCIIVASNIDNRILGKRLLEDDGIAVAAYTETTGDAFLKISGIYPDAVIMFDEGTPALFELSRRIYVSLPGTLVVLISPNGDGEYIRTAMQNGFHLVLSPDTGKAAFLAGLNSLVNVEKKRLTDDQRHSVSARVISVYGSKGGCGKTTVAVNLAVLLAQKRKKTILIDASLEFGDVCLYLDITPKETISELVQEGTNFTIDSINTFTVLHQSGLNVLSAPRSPELAEYVRDEHLDRLISIMRPYYDYIIIDLPVTPNPVTLAAIEGSDTVLVVVPPDIAGLKNMHLIMKIMKSLQQSDKFAAVFNRAGGGALSAKDFKSNITMPIAGVIREDSGNVPISIGKGTPVVTAYPRSHAAADLRSLAAYVTGDGKLKKNDSKSGVKNKDKNKYKIKASDTELDPGAGSKNKKDKKDKSEKKPEKKSRIKSRADVRSGTPVFTFTPVHVPPVVTANDPIHVAAARPAPGTNPVTDTAPKPVASTEAEIPTASAPAASVPTASVATEDRSAVAEESGVKGAGE